MIVLILILIITLSLYITRQRNREYKCFVITIPSSKQRYNNFINSYDKSVPLEVIYGKDTREPENAREFTGYIKDNYYRQALKLHYDPSSIRPDITYFNLGAIGCFMAHMDFYDRCFNQGLKYAVVFEDNVIIKNRAAFSEIQDVIDELGDDFEMCFFHCLSRYPKTEMSASGLEQVHWISSTKCYLIHVDNMKKYHEHFLPMDNHIDMKHEDLIDKGARVYYKDLRHCLKIDRSNKSTIGHSDWHKKEFFSKRHPDANPGVLKYGY